ncbi:DoxX family protein [Variovorax ginsengisoli]|uniref:Oxidoreductase n=1 Tax=Variovorax ginsengisoli TaxID=363844 RepID=A0ABT9S3R4_9BURK|nr:DoxX family protein [Variovorax ginsengisoli]MDP9898564.1 putative oxidoreductase [Variovorax ginsengisoli]
MSNATPPIGVLAPHTAERLDDAGKLLLRLTIGLLILLHGIAKLSTGPGFVVSMLEKAGLPGSIGYLVYVGEVIAPLLMIVGLWTRAAAAVVAFNMVIAFALVHMGSLFTIGKQGGWALELQGLFLFGALAVVLLGAGRLSIGGKAGRFN